VAYPWGVKILILTFAVFLIAILAMSVGVLLGRPRLKGSCGGVDREGRPLGDCACAQQQKLACATPTPVLESPREELRSELLSQSSGRRS
jgi:hypothetical protein